MLPHLSKKSMYHLRAHQNHLLTQSMNKLKMSTQKINVSGGMHHEQLLLKVDMDAIESFVKTYVDKRFDHIEALMKRHHKKMKKQHEEMMSAVKEKHDAPQKESSSVILIVAFQEFIDNIIIEISITDVAIQSVELSQKVNLSDPSLPTNNIEVQNESQLAETVHFRDFTSLSSKNKYLLIEADDGTVLTRLLTKTPTAGKYADPWPPLQNSLHMSDWTLKHDIGAN
ncbi:hypothetical protein T459_01082 [Capsicum annuum]|uniref:Uncharacterized protein n=1 Tax=Capsicum annuum TaxID=4072 RepID=A0A2G3AG64_CAPAN|nr:hypothetical protein T459_01082 [Capsicum annuum]